MDKYFCPFCGSPMTSDNFCDSCGSEMLPADRLTAAQLRNWVRLPQSAIRGVFLGGAIVSMLAFVGFFTITAGRFINWAGVMLAASVGLFITATIACIGEAVVRRLFGRLAARRLDQLTELSFCAAGGMAVWPFIACLCAIF